ncbi:MAG: T9SS type A sorting domain-containing protein [Sphingobacteriales bacterium]|nr:MAG: T9SS type A sorting domain-containing protein [Sphingobacteriales bacterium]
MKRIYLLSFALSFMPFISKAQNDVTRIYSDFGGYWNSSYVANSQVQPNNSHNLLAFKVGSTTYSTGVNDALLATKGVAFTKQKFQALPVASVPTNNINGSTNPIVIGVGSQYGGGNGDVSPVPVTSDLNSYLTDGAQGLDLGTGIYNIPGGIELKYSVSNIHASKIGDGIPDLVLTQIGVPPSSGVNDVYRFFDAAGNTVGNSVSINVSNIAIVAQIHMKFYNPTNPPTYNSGLYGERDLRLVSYDFSAFGIDASNIGKIVGFGQVLSGASDQAFVAYNASSVTILQSISGTVFEDPDGGEPSGTGYTGRTAIKLLNANNAVIESTTSDAHGYYSFPNIAPGNYKVRLTVPSGYRLTGSSYGNADTVAPLTVSNSPVIANFGLANTATPVTLLTFEASKKDNTALLVWATATEQDNSGFNVERSIDGRSWATIGFVASKSENGKSSIRKDYNFTDNKPLNGRNYYRLKQTDHNGSYAYSEVQMIAIVKTATIDIYPNPATDRLSLSGLKGNETIFIYDVSGKLILHVKAESALVHISLNNLAEGMYHINITDEEGSSSVYKIMKSK